MGGYGGGGMIPAGQGSRPLNGFNGVAFDEDVYIDTIPKVFEYIRGKLGPQAKILNDVHEHPTPTGAVELAKPLDPYAQLFVEDLLAPGQIDSSRPITQRCT